MNQLPQIRKRIRKQIRLHEAQIIASTGATYSKFTKEKVK